MSSIRKVERRARGHVYRYFALRYTDPSSGKPVVRYFKRRQEAIDEQLALGLAIKEGRYNARSGSVTISELATAWRAAAYCPKKTAALRSTTKASYELGLARILKRFGAVRVKLIQTSHVEAWRDALLAEGAGASTVRNAMLTLGLLFRFAMRDHLATFNPVELARRPVVGSRKAMTLSPEQLEGLFAAARGRARIVIRLGACTGMRRGEIMGLTWGAVDLENREIRVAQQWTHGQLVRTKTEAGMRTIGIDAKLAAELSAWKLAQRPELKRPESFVVGSREGQAMSASNFMNRDWHPTLARAGLPPMPFHVLRHVCATALVSAGLPPGAVHRHLGHGSFQTTLKLYGTLTSAVRAQAAEAIAAAFEPKTAKQESNIGEKA